MALLYEAFRAGQPSPLGPLPVQYADYAVWQRRRLQGETLERLLDYSAPAAAGCRALGTADRSVRSLQPEAAGASEAMQLPPALLAGLREAGRREGATLYMTLLAALQVLLYRYSGQEDFTVGSPIAGRLGKETEGLVGFFVNTLVMRADLAGDPSFRELAAANAADRPGRISTPGIALRAAGRRPEPGAGRKPQSAVSGHVYAANAPWPELTVAGLALSRSSRWTPACRCSSCRSPCGKSATGLRYRPNTAPICFAPGTIRRMLKHFQILLEGDRRGAGPADRRNFPC